MKLYLEDGWLRVRMEGLEKVWSLRGSLSLPLSDIIKVNAYPKSAGKPEVIWWGIRAHGTFLPWVIRAGSYYARRWEFWWYTWGTGYLKLKLSRGHYRPIILSMGDAEAWRSRIMDYRPGSTA